MRQKIKKNDLYTLSDAFDVEIYREDRYSQNLVRVSIRNKDWPYRQVVQRLNGTTIIVIDPDACREISLSKTPLTNRILTSVLVDGKYLCYAYKTDLVRFVNCYLRDIDVVSM